MEDAMRNMEIPLFSLESRKPLKEFDLVGFSIPYETLNTNVLNMLDLASIPLRSSDRIEGDPIIIAGGHACMNPEPMHAFIDLFVIGEGEEIINEIIDILRTSKDTSRDQKISALADLPGIYAPSHFQISYNRDNTIKEITNH